MRRSALRTAPILAGVALALMGSQAQADKMGMMEILGGYGCTLSPESRRALLDATHDEADITTMSKSLLERGNAQQEGAYVVFDESVCSIKLPIVKNTASLGDPDIAATISAPDHYVGETRKMNEEFGENESGEGCYLMDTSAVFDKRAGGVRGAGTVDYIRFLGAHAIAGDLRFYSPNPLKTPISFRVMRGDCAKTQGAEEILANHAYFEKGFGEYVRTLHRTSTCGGGFSTKAMRAVVEMQGGSFDSNETPETPINALLFFEFDMIARAAGWYEGMSGTSKGTPRPPLCTYSSGD